MLARDGNCPFCKAPPRAIHNVRTYLFVDVDVFLYECAMCGSIIQEGHFINGEED